MGHAVNSPEPKLLKELHALAFGDILAKGWIFRDNVSGVFTKDAVELCPAHEIEPWLRIAAFVSGKFLEKPKYHTADSSQQVIPATNQEMVETVSAYHSHLMQIRPFKDNLENPFINRTIAAIVLESQLGHCFNSNGLNREIRADIYAAALHWSHEFSSETKLRSLVRDLAGDGYDVHQFERYRERSLVLKKEQEHERGR